MPRQIRIQYPGAFYHVMARGDRRETIFSDDLDRQMMLHTLSQATAQTGWRVHAWVLMSNHYHLLIETPQPNLVAGMAWFQNTYTRRFNSRHRLWGHLFGGRYKAILVQAEAEEDYFASLWDYIHLNPVRAGLIAPDHPLGLLFYPWSSLTQVFTVSPGKRPKWCTTDLSFRCFGLRDSVAGRRSLVERLEARMRLEESKHCGWTTRAGQSLNSTLNRGWYWGNEAFRQQLLERVSETLRGVRHRNHQSSRLAKDHAEARAAEVIELGLRIFGLTETELRSDRINQRYRVALAWALTRRTTLNQRWIAERLGLSSAANVSQQTRRFQLAPGTKQDNRVRKFLQSIQSLEG